MNELDRAIMRLALLDAKRRIREGCLPQEAAASATPGAWQEFRSDVLSELLEHPVAQNEIPDARFDLNHSAAAK